MIRDTVRDIARERIAPRAAEIDRTGEFPWDVVDLFRKHDSSHCRSHLTMVGSRGVR